MMSTKILKNETVATSNEKLERMAAALEKLAGGTLFDYDNAGSHNCMYRGKNLGSAFTAEQAAAIEAGTFDNLYVGDYWSFSKVPYTYYYPTTDTTAQSGKTYYADVNGTALATQPTAGDDISEAGYCEKFSATFTGNMRIADCDYFLSVGGRENLTTDTHHLIIVPDATLYNYVMNNTNTAEGAYVGSKMRTVGLTQAKALFLAAFGSGTLMPTRQPFPNAVVDGHPYGYAWNDSDGAELMTEQQVFGGLIFNSGIGTAGNVTGRSTLTTKQFNMFRHRPDLIVYIYKTYWLQDVASSSTFVCIYPGGAPTVENASAVYGVRPAFVLRKAA